MAAFLLWRMADYVGQLQKYVMIASLPSSNDGDAQPK